MVQRLSHWFDERSVNGGWESANVPKPLLKLHFVEAIAELVGKEQGLFVRAGERVDRIEISRDPAQLAQFSKDFAVQAELENLADAADKDHLVGAWSDAQRPRQPGNRVDIFEIPIGVENLHAAVLPVGDIEGSLGVDHDTVRRVELTVAGAAVAPIFDEVAFLTELHDSRISVAVGDEEASIRSDGGVGGLIKICRRRNSALDAVCHPDPGFGTPAESHAHVPV